MIISYLIADLRKLAQEYYDYEKFYFDCLYFYFQAVFPMHEG